MPTNINNHPNVKNIIDVAIYLGCKNDAIPLTDENKNIFFGKLSSGFLNNIADEIISKEATKLS